MKIEVEVPIQNIYNALSGPHSRYWATDYRWENGMDIGYVVDWFDGDRGYELHSGNLRTGLEIMANEYPKTFARIVDGSSDGPDGDTLLQLMAFGEVKYSW